MSAEEPLGIAAWADGMEPGILAGSVYSLPRAYRLSAARLLAEGGHRIHADLIVEPTGEHTGIHPSELGPLRGSCGRAPLDVHMMLPGPPLTEGQREAAEQAIGMAREAGAGSLTFPIHGFSTFHRLLGRLRAEGMPVWAEVPPEMPELPEDNAADGALVMLIPPGTRQAADPAHLSKVRALSTTMPTGVDGGVTQDIAIEARAAGAGMVVSGRALFILPNKERP